MDSHYPIIKENTPTLETERLILCRFQKSDAPCLLSLLEDAEVNTYLPWFPLKNLQEAEEFLQQHFLSYYEEESAYRYAIWTKESWELIGYLWVSNDESHDLGYGLKKAFWHRGFATEAAMMVVERLKNAGFPYITATHDRNNLSSGQVMKRLGMTYRYSYVEQWQPKDITVTFRLYQLDFCGDHQTYMNYWNRYPQHFVETNL